MSTPHKFIKDLAAYETIDQTFQVVGKQLRKKKDGSDYIRLELRDKTGKISTNIWDNLSQLDPIGQYSFVRIKGQIDIYKGELQVNTTAIRPVSEKEIDPEIFTPHSPKDIGLLFKELEAALLKVKDPYLVKLIETFLRDADFVSAFKKSPAAVEKHQPYAGGLLEHTVNLLNLAQGVSAYYQTINTDILFTGIFLHDIGKIKEYEIKISPQMTDEGRLLGHTIFGILMLEEKIKAIKDFPAEYKLLLEHLIASHHGQYEYGAPVLPMTQEALVLHYLDNLDARMGEYQTLQQNTPANSVWTEWSKS
ncbi:MAG: HD domain-containing protein, partial [Planctomycetota bacterium]|nr:HD domain-containing protein [Planctomycetota bacterium]